MTQTQTQSGFTLVEMIVALGVFSVVVTIAVGALLSLISSNTRLQAEQNVMTSLSFALDTMTRELRTGSYYYCSGRNNYAAGGPNNIFNDSNDHEAEVTPTGTQDCANGRGSNELLQGVSFVEGGDSLTGATAERIIYFYDGTDATTPTIKRRVGNGVAQSIISSGLYIEDAEFVVTGSDDSVSGDAEQPTVTIYIKAREKNDTSAKVYEVETTITQRSLDL